MQADLGKLLDFLVQPRTQFVIPVYQRNYDWTELQCRQLLKDIYEIGKNDSLPSHFVGSIVFIQDSIYSTTNRNILTIIDGQQRLTTITLLLLSLSHKAKEQGNQELADELFEDYIINKRFDEEKLKLRPVKRDNNALQYLIQNDFSTPFREFSRIIENYKFFQNEISDENLELVMKGINKLLFVEVSLERGKDDPQRIFESLNSTGLDLSQADLIRNYVLMDIEPNEQTRIYENYWVKIEQFCVESSSKQTKLSDFVRDFLTFKFRQIPPKSQIFQWFKKKYDFSGKSYTEKLSELENLLEELKRYASFYGKLINNETEPDEEIREHLKYINRLEVNVAFPFLLEVYDDYATGIIDKETIVNVLKLVQSFSWRRFICDVPTNSLNKIFMTLYQSVETDNYLPSLEISLIKKKGQQRFPSDSEIVESLKVKNFYSAQAKNRLYYLERLENYDKNIPFQIEGNDSVTTEHILPQTPSEEWKRQLGEQLKETYERYLHTIANLTISGNNGELGNKSFVEKRDMGGFGYRASGLWLNQYLASIDKWTETEILERLKIITDRTLQIWAYPENSVLLVEDGEETNVFDIEDPTGKRIEYFTFLDSKYTKRYFSDVLQIVVKTLFEIEADRFFNTDLAEKLKLTTEKDILRQPLQISSSYFIESHYSSIAIINKLQKILEAFNLYDELYIKFAV